MVEPFILRMYRENVGVVEALRFTGTNQRAVKGFIAMHGGRRPEDAEEDAIPFVDQRGRMCIADPGDYVVATNALIWVETSHRFADESGLPVHHD